MNIYQPMLFVGLGGTGCLIGAELERRLRDQLCGADGRALTTRVPGKNYLPYQLPSCLQFVYADLNESELTRLRHRVVPSEDHANAAGPTQHLTHGLIPTVDTYPDVARSLRINAMDYVRDWLPPAAGEPKVSPLVRGAGQLPTVGRAALFETFRSGVEPARQPIAAAVGEISSSGPELAALGGRLGQTCDVFVAFSVAGGTGAGIFYDYLHLLGDVFQRTGFRAQVYPLVLMPSAFEQGVGGGRRAKLNAGRALLDLFRLIDDQNGRNAGTDLTSRGTSGTLGVRYPDRDGIVSLMPSTIQTGFLFHRADGVERDDLHRSVVSLILSLVGTGQEHDDGGAISDRIYQSFADDFINRGVEREVAASSGIGRRGVSTSLVASMTIPVDDLADIVASRLLARAVDDLTMRAPGGSPEDHAGLVRRFASAANIGQIVTRAPLEFSEPPPARGSALILSALRTRIQTMQSNLTALHGVVRRTVPDLASNFDPAAGLDDLLTDIDLFHARRVVDGDPNTQDGVGRGGIVGFLTNRRAEPPAPPGFTINPPALRPIKDKRLGTDKAKWGDREVQTTIDEQDTWYNWRARCLWNSAWDEQHNRWDKVMRRLRTQLKGFIDAFDEHVQAEPGEFARRTAELYRPRVGVTYLLPPQGDMDAFYRETFGRLVAAYSDRSSATEGEIVDRVLGPDGWRHVWASTVDRGAEAGVSAARDRLKEEVKRLFLQHDGYEAEPLLPTMASLLDRGGTPRRRRRRRRRRRPPVPRQGPRPGAGELLPAGFRKPEGVGLLPRRQQGHPDRALPGVGDPLAEGGRHCQGIPADQRRLHRGRVVPDLDEHHRGPGATRDLAPLGGCAEQRAVAGLPALAPTARLRLRLAGDDGGGPSPHPAPPALCNVERPGGRTRRRSRLPVHDPGVARRGRRGRDDPRPHPVRAGVVVGQHAARLRGLVPGRRRARPPRLLRTADAHPAGRCRGAARRPAHGVPDVHRQRRQAGPAATGHARQAAAQQPRVGRPAARVLGDNGTRRPRHAFRERRDPGASQSSPALRHGRGP